MLKNVYIFNILPRDWTYVWIEIIHWFFTSIYIMTTVDTLLIGLDVIFLIVWAVLNWSSSWVSDKIPSLSIIMLY